MNKANKVLGPRFLTKYGTKQGVLVLSKQIPLGIGIAVGGGANHLVGRGVVRTARKVFGPPPEAFAPALVIEVVDEVINDASSLSGPDMRKDEIDNDGSDTQEDRGDEATG